MKKIIALLLLLGLTQMALAQGTIQLGNNGGGLSGIGVGGFGGFGGGDLVQLNINFSLLPGSAGANQPIGNASFSHNPEILYTPFPVEATNTF
jgi:hypothetical protein